MRRSNPVFKHTGLQRQQKAQARNDESELCNNAHLNYIINKITINQQVGDRSDLKMLRKRQRIYNLEQLNQVEEKLNDLERYYDVAPTSRTPR